MNDKVTLEMAPLPPLFIGKDGHRADNACADFITTGNIFRLFGMIGIIAGIVVGAVVPEYFSVGFIIAGVIYFFHLIDSFWVNSTLKFLKNIGMAGDIFQHVEHVKAARPSIIWRMSCYHQETTHTEVEDGVDSNGNKQYRTETKTEDHVTWVGSQEFVFRDCWDTSPPLLGLGDYQRTRIQFHKEYLFADAASQASFETQLNYFVAMNKDRDCSYRIDTEYNIDGYLDTALATTTGENPFYLNPACYIFAVIFLMALPFSFIVKMKCPRMDFTYVKTFRC